MRLIYSFRRRYAVPAIGALLLAVAVIDPIESLILGPQTAHGSQRTGIHLLLMLALGVWWYVPLNAGWQKWLRLQPSPFPYVDDSKEPAGMGTRAPGDAEGAQAGRFDEVYTRQRETMVGRAVIAGVILLSLYHREDLTAARIVSSRGARVTCAVVLLGLLLAALTLTVFR